MDRSVYKILGIILLIANNIFWAATMGSKIFICLMVLANLIVICYCFFLSQERNDEKAGFSASTMKEGSKK
ncbi:MAG: hypothetical protein LKJ45_06960 [Oscillospiraceae bacterium]|jgi:Tfp pilus assembly protein PilO|nr:hypothetical protein [Oscillospiraceae bacterium]